MMGYGLGGYMLQPFQRLKDMMSDDMLAAVEKQTDLLSVHATWWCNSGDQAYANQLWQEWVG